MNNQGIIEMTATTYSQLEQTLRSAVWQGKPVWLYYCAVFFGRGLSGSIINLAPGRKVR